MDPDRKIRLTVGTWAKGSRHRFSFFASDETQSTERSLDVDQLDVWAECKNDIVHLFADLDQKSRIDGDGVLLFYARRMFFDRLIEDFKLSQKTAEREALCNTRNLISDAQWKAIYHALRIRSRRPFNLIDFKSFLCFFFKLSSDFIECSQTCDRIAIIFHDQHKKEYDLQMKLIEYLFCPLDRAMTYKWQAPGSIEPLSSTPNLEYSEPQTPLFPKKLTQLIVWILSSIWELSVALLKHLAILTWRSLVLLSKWIVRHTTWKRFFAAILLLAALLTSVFIFRYFHPPANQAVLTHKAISSMDGLLPVKAVKKGRCNAPYRANGKPYRPMSREEAKSYRRIGVASHYGKEKAGLTVSGEIFEPDGLTAAHETLPIPSMVRVTNLKNNRSIKLIVNDRGPFTHGRLINVSDGAARALDFYKEGTTRVLVEVIDSQPNP
jgi:rare lipoprotein A